MQNVIININGEIQHTESSSDLANISVFDRGYLYGDSLYEVIRSYNGHFFLLDEHLSRLEGSARLCRMLLGQSTAHYRDELLRTFDAFKSTNGCKNTDVYARLIISRGTGRIGFGLPCLTSTTKYAIILQSVEAFSAARHDHHNHNNNHGGVHLQISQRLRNDPRALDPAMKSGNYLNNLLAYLEASSEGYDDAILCDAEGFVTEGTTFNMFYVHRGIIATPPLSVGILDGITRRYVMSLAGKLGIEMREVLFPAQRLYDADEIFVTSTLKEVMPVERIDGRQVGNGQWPITKKLHHAFKESLSL